MLFLLDTVFILICLLLVFMVVITPSQSEGLAGAFGGMGSDTFFGTKAHQHISKFTIFLATAFLILGIGINFAVKGKTGTKKGPPSIMDNAPGTAPTGTNPAPTTNPPPPPGKNP